MGPRAIVLALCVAASACSIRVSEDDNASNRAQCGNGRLDEGEVCDDGNTDDGDGCSADCASDESCGNGVVDTAIGESCDDGNALGGDGCSSDCKSTEECGNGVVDIATGESCDDGNLILGDGCSANCQSNEDCGNGIVDPGTTPVELCDGGPNGSATCNKNCTPQRCPDGIVNTLAGEECDDNNSNNGDACDNLCRKVECGDGETTGNEQCDDANSVSTDACINCVAARCGDGFVQAGVEACDDNNNNNGDGCDAGCHFEPVVFGISVNELLNQDSSCDGIGENRYDGCNGEPYGFSWDDNSQFSPSTIQIDFDRGIDCYNNYYGLTAYDVTIRLNGVPTTITMDSDTQGCLCTPGEVIRTIQIPANGYNVGGNNQLMWDGTPPPDPSTEGPGICAGFSFDEGLNGYARVTAIP